MRTLTPLLAFPLAFALVLAGGRWLRGGATDEPFEAAQLSAPPWVRVGLAGALEVSSVKVAVPGPVRVLDPQGLEVLWEGPGLSGDASPLPPPGGIRLSGRLAFPIDELLVVPARSGALTVNGRAYRGALRLLAFAKGPKRILSAVNEVEVERYLDGVVASEMGADWPEEALRAQAVAARSYALYEMRNGARKARGFDVYNDDRSQYYGGVAREAASARRAAHDTYGAVCGYGGRPFKTFYQNTCGGRTESARVVFAESDIPPLAGRACAYCDRSPHYRWEIAISKLDLAAKVIGSRKFGGVPRARVLERTPGGMVLKVGVTSPMKGNNELAMSGADFRRAAETRKFESLAFDIVEAEDRFLIQGRGWGHLVGLCQEGAKGFAERVPGATWRQILEYYYPGATVGRMY